MPQVSLELGLAIGGIALTFILLVLDKAEKVKGGMLYVLLAVAALMIVPLALGNPLVSGVPSKWKWWASALALLMVAVVFWGIAIWITPIPPVLVPKTILSAKRAIVPAIEIGASGVVFGAPGNGGYNLDDLIPILKECEFSVESISGQIKVSIIIRDANGNVVAEIIRNEWSVAGRPVSWDRNYNQDSLEVKDNRGKVVLQVTALPDIIILQANWFKKNGHKAYAIQSNGRGGRPKEGYAMFILDSPPEQFSSDDPRLEIEPMFQYPSETHLGELLNAPR
jgi:hypothetical protein